MTKYRLRPVSESMWVVQRKGLFFWHDLTKGLRTLKRAGIFGSDILVSDPHYVHSVKEGEQVIAAEREHEEWRKRDAERKRAFLKANKPLEY